MNNMGKNMKQQGFDISALVDDLQPVRVLNSKHAAYILAGITAAFIALVAAGIGFRDDLVSGKPAEIFLIRAGILLLLGCASAYAALSMASPSVGKHNNGWQMAVAGALLFPLSAMIVAMTGNIDPAIANVKSGIECMMMSIGGGFFIAIPMCIWLRRGAPTSLNRAGWLTGIASGGLSAFAYNFHCPFNSIVYIGFWYSLSVILCAVAGRLLIPRLIRW
jgi:hypothetical protein